MVLTLPLTAHDTAAPTINILIDPRGLVIRTADGFVVAPWCDLLSASFSSTSNHTRDLCIAQEFQTIATRIRENVAHENKAQRDE